MNTLKKMLLFLVAFLIIGNTSQAQAPAPQSAPLNPMYLHVFDADSLRGFDEISARKDAFDNQYFGSELKTIMYHHKREYIKQKYHLVSAPEVFSNNHSYVARPTVDPGCTNEDFEASTAGVINSSSQINGWTITSGTIPTNNDNCVNLPPGNNPANGKSELIDCTGGYTDSQIGASYKIYSLFGSGAPNAAAMADNPQVNGGMFGNKVLRLNDPVINDDSEQKLSKTFAVSANNALFRFAFISVIAPNHGCCAGSGVQLKLYSGGGTPIACPAFSIYAPSSACLSGDAQSVQYYVSGSNTPYTSGSANSIYNKWKVSAIDLSQYIGQSITIEIIAYDCNAGGHYGYLYFDAQCAPMTVIGNGIEFEATITETPNIATCGVAGATVCAVEGMGPYSWQGPGLPVGYATPSMTNQCIVTNLSDTYTLNMFPQGSCAPISRIIHTYNQPAPLLLAHNVQASCGNTLSVVTLTPGGSLTPGANYTVNWSPPPPTLSTNSLTGTYVVPAPLSSPLLVTVTAIDTSGCFAISNLSINPTVPLPTFTLFNATGVSSITCNNSAVNLVANSNYNYGNVEYNWVGPATNSIGVGVNNVVFNSAGNVSVTAHDVSYTCAVTHTFYIGTNTTVPTLGLINPTIQAITCAIPDIQTMTITATNPTINISHIVSSPAIGGSLTISTASTAIYSPVPGDYDYWLVNNITGCSTHRTFSVTTSGNFPTLQISSTPTLAGQGNYTVGCNNHSLTVINLVNPNTTPPGGALYFAFIPPGQINSPTTTAQYTVVSTPGTWTIVAYDDVNNCAARIPVTIIQNTVAPNLSAYVPTQILSCATPSTILSAQSSNENATPNWLIPGLGSFPSPTVAVNSTTNTSSTSAGNYTLVILDQNNGCTSNSVIPMQQNMFAPKANISVTSNTITCFTPTLQLTNASTTGIPPGVGFPTTGIVQAFVWEGPAPQPTLGLQSSYIAATPGTYTLTVKDLNNGCMSYTTLVLQDGRIYPVVTPQASPYLFDCGAASATIMAVMSNTQSMSYQWTGPSTATFVVGTATAQIAEVKTVGAYIVRITNTANGCEAEATISLVNGALSGGFTPNNTSGFAPLTVNFTNNSKSSSPTTGTQSITSVWNFGNGTTTTYTVANSNASNGQAIYTQPGTYKVVLYTSKGSCTDIDTVFIQVDIPSSLEVPNVFTPNGDGVNDLFFLKVANLTEIQMTIYDRWGHVVYELNSDTGNIAWDGLNAYGKESAVGTYFYVVKGKGKDGKDYNTKGTINLYR